MKINAPHSQFKKLEKKIAKTTNKDFCVPFYITRKIKIRAEINDVRTEK